VQRPHREAVPGDVQPEADWGEHVTDDEYRSRLSRLQHSEPICDDELPVT
jgi:hypothetical protein